MAIKLGILPHQTECLDRINKVFEDIPLKITKDIFANPIFDKDDVRLKIKLL